MRTSNINEEIGESVRRLRAERALTLDALAERSGVSRSAISVIERAESSPTATVLEKLARGLDVTLATLFETATGDPDPVSRRADQREWIDPGSGYRRRNVSPGGSQSPIQIVEVVFPPGANVSYETEVFRHFIHQQVWLLEGTMEIVVGADRYLLHRGDCVAFIVDRPTSFYNPTDKRARYALVQVVAPIHWKPIPTLGAVQ